jgi:hypothetical protein
MTSPFKVGAAGVCRCEMCEPEPCELCGGRGRLADAPCPCPLGDSGRSNDERDAEAQGVAAAMTGRA